MDIKVYVRGAEVVASGIVHTSANAPIDITINGMPMQIRFFDDWSNQAVRYDSRTEGGMWVLNLTNFSFPSGEGLFDPIPVTVIAGRQLSMTFTIGTTNRAVGIRTFSYSFLLG
jgi:hypothetical protein